MTGAANTTGANNNIIVAVLRVIDSRQRLLDWEGVGLSEAAIVLTAESIFSSLCSRVELQFFHLTLSVRWPKRRSTPLMRTHILNSKAQRRKGAKRFLRVLFTPFQTYSVSSP